MYKDVIEKPYSTNFFSLSLFLTLSGLSLMVAFFYQFTYLLAVAIKFEVSHHSRTFPKNLSIQFTRGYTVWFGVRDDIAQSKNPRDQKAEKKKKKNQVSIKNKTTDHVNR